ncbi:MAG: helix-turn-helix domain-containing protein [Anaerolineae bacterium]|nr:helix-turn-helix domain-containing protein [Anaerolineae bacterium]
MDIPAPDVWLDDELRRLGLNYNQLAQKAGISPSSITEFRRGKAGPAVCTALATVLGVSPLWLMVVAGVAPPPRTLDVNSDRIATIFSALDESRQQTLMAFAEWLRERMLTEQFRR